MEREKRPVEVKPRSMTMKMSNYLYLANVMSILKGNINNDDHDNVIQRCKNPRTELRCAHVTIQVCIANSQRRVRRKVI